MKPLNIRVRTMQSGRGNDIANQFEIFTEEGVYFQSYRTIIAFKATGQVYLDEGSWDYSMTTGKYRNIFLGEDKKETNRKIKAGVYKLVNLNESSI